jgi:hypothetical protein
MSLVAAGLWIVGTIMGRLAMRSMQADDSTHRPDDGRRDRRRERGGVAPAVRLYADTHRDPQRILDLGLAYMILTALTLGLTFHSGPIRPTLKVITQHLQGSAGATVSANRTVGVPRDHPLERTRDRHRSGPARLAVSNFHGVR